MKKILFCLGTRPEAIKLAPLIKYCVDNVVPFEVCLSGQHKDMIAPFMDFFKIRPDYDLEIMKHGQSLAGITSSILLKMDNVLNKSRPDVVVVQGDTTTTYSCGLAAFYKQIPVAHVEAGLRTGKIYSPFPEEVNRKMVSAFSSYNFTPTEQARENLKREGILENVWVTGNTSIDALEMTLYEIKKSNLESSLRKKYKEINFKRPYILVTTHRRENLGSPLHQICKSIKKIVEDFDVQVVFPVHLNPMVREVIDEHLAGDERIHLLPPLDYKDFVWIMSQAHLIMSDSGGVQEEAPHFKVPILVLREDTERPEGIEVSVSKLVGSNSETIYAEVKKILESQDYYNSFSVNSNPYGDGRASQKIIDKILKC